MCLFFHRMQDYQISNRPSVFQKQPIPDRTVPLDDSVLNCEAGIRYQRVFFLS